MTAFPDPEVRLREVILRGRGRTPSGEYTRIVDFPRVLKDTDDKFHVFKRLGIEKPENPVGAFIGIECLYHGIYPGLAREGEVILDPMLAYLVALVQYGYEEMKTYHSVRAWREWNPPEPVFPKGFETPMPNKPVKDGMNCYGGRMNMPTFSQGPRGYRATSRLGSSNAVLNRFLAAPNRNNAVLNCFLAAIAFGAGTMKTYDNVLPDFRPDDTEDRLKIILVELERHGVEVVEDSGWRGRPGGRCITDYSRTVTFSTTPSDADLALFQEMLSLDECPGWTSIGSHQVNFAKYIFTTTMDSSD